MAGTTIEEILWRQFYRYGAIQVPIERTTHWRSAGKAMVRFQNGHIAFLRLLMERLRSLREQHERRTTQYTPSALITEARPYARGGRWGRTYERYLAPKRTQC